MLTKSVEDQLNCLAFNVCVVLNKRHFHSHTHTYTHRPTDTNRHSDTHRKEQPITP
jgi:hypothetical protein